MHRMLSVATVLALTCFSAQAAEIEVKMLNRGAEGAMVFEPAFIKAAQGDTIRFIATDKGHNAETIDGMLPEGVAPITGKMNEEIVIKVEKDGVYGLRCKPHYAMGMVALILVGAPGQLDQAKAVTHPGRAKTIFAQLFERASANAAR